MTERHWSTDYLGLRWCRFGRDRPWIDANGVIKGGVDCWGIVALVLKERHGITVPSYEGAPGAEELDEIQAALKGDADEAWPWLEVTRDDVQPCDLVTFKLGEIEGHVGIIPWLRPHDFLHIGPGLTSRIENYDGKKWGSMINRFLRHKALMACPTV